MEILEGGLEGDLDRIHGEREGRGCVEGVGEEVDIFMSETLELVVYEVCILLRKLHVLAVVG